jgi:thiamine-phosphate pyrophosphorylase
MELPVAKTKSTSKTNAKNENAALDWPACQLMLTVAPGPGSAEKLRAMFGHCQPVAVLIRPLPQHHLGAGEVKPLVDVAQEFGAAAIIFDDVRLAQTLHADGVHLVLDRGGDVGAAIAAARSSLGAAANIGVDPGISRHRAMEAGEAGADYVAFSVADGSDVARQARDDLIGWWGEIFEVPCVALDVATADEASTLDMHGADFVALTVPSVCALEAAMVLAGEVDAVLGVMGAGE